MEVNSNTGESGWHYVDIMWEHSHVKQILFLTGNCIVVDADIGRFSIPELAYLLVLTSLYISMS